MESIFIIGFGQGLFLSILLLAKKRKQVYDYMLLFFILLMTFRLLFLHFKEIGSYQDYPWLINIEFCYWPMFGPALYVYIDLITNKAVKLKWKHLIHLIPIAIVLIGFFDYIQISGSTLHDNYVNDSFLYQISTMFWYFTTHVYWIFCLIKLHRHRISLKHFFSYRQDIDLKWLIILTYGFGLFIFVAMVLILTNNYIPIRYQPFGREVVWLIMVVYLFGIGFYGYKQKGIFDSSSDSDDGKTNSNKDEKQLYAKSRISDNEMKALASSLIHELEVNKAYLDYSLDIRILAEKLETTTYKISQTINIHLEKNFFDLVNEYRIKFAKQCLSSPDYANEKIMSIAYDSGFNSKSTFFSIFKKATQMTPSEYRKKYN